MYINDISIVMYIIMTVLGVIFGQVSDFLNVALPEHKEIFSLKTIKEYVKKAKPNWVLMLINIVLFNAIMYQNGLIDIQVIQFVILIPLLTSAFVIDYKYKIIPNRLTLMIFEVGLIFTFLHGVSNVNIAINMLEGFAVGAIIFLAITFFGGYIFGKESMGFGDVKMIATIGLFFGLQGTMAIIVMSFLVAALTSVVIIIARKVQKKEAIEYIAFGPFIVIASIIAMLVPIETLITLPLFVFTLGKYKI